MQQMKKFGIQMIEESKEILLKHLYKRILILILLASSNPFSIGPQKQKKVIHFSRWIRFVVMAVDGKIIRWIIIVKVIIQVLDSHEFLSFKGECLESYLWTSLHQYHVSFVYQFYARVCFPCSLGSLKRYSRKHDAIWFIVLSS